MLAKDGVIGLFGRGLKTKILANGLQGMLFTVRTLLTCLEEVLLGCRLAAFCTSLFGMRRTRWKSRVSAPHALVHTRQVLWRLGQDAWNKQVAAS